MPLSVASSFARLTTLSVLSAILLSASARPFSRATTLFVRAVIASLSVFSASASASSRPLILVFASASPATSASTVV